MSAPAGWHANYAELTTIWTTTTRSIPGVLTDLAELLAADGAALLHSLFVSPTTPDDDDLAWIVQVVLSHVRDDPPT